MERPKGELRVSLGFRSEELRHAVFPVRVYRPDSTLVAEGVSSDPLKLDAGTYYVTIQMPAGQELSSKVEVAAGSSELVEVSPYDGAEPSSEAREVWRFLGGSGSDIQEGAARGGASDRRFRLTEGPAGRRSLPGRLRLFKGNLLAGECEPLGVGASGVPHVGAPDVPRLGTALRFTPMGNASLVQLLQPDFEPLNVAIPAGEFGDCFLYLHRHADAYSADVHLANATADSFVRYVEEGRLLDASLMAGAPKFIAGDLGEHRGGGRTDPAAAAVSVYALLRFGGSEQLWNWADKLWPLFERLPDALCIRGERLAREGRHADAFAEFVRLSERGLPFFTDGLTYTIDRLKLYLRAPRPSFDAETLEAAERLFTRLETFCQCADFGRQLTTFTGLNPLAPDDVEFDGDVGEMEGLDLSRFRLSPLA